MTTEGKGTEVKAGEKTMALAETGDIINPDFPKYYIEIEACIKMQALFIYESLQENHIFYPYGYGS